MHPEKRPQSRNGNLNFLAVNPRRRKCDRKTDPGIEQHVIVGIVPEVAAEDVAINPQLPDE